MSKAKEPQIDDKKKKQKWKKVEVQDIQKGHYLLPTRNECDCMATKHSLINNCLICGRVVCEQEGEGPCYFCGNPVYRQGNPLGEQSFVSFEEMQAADINKQKAIAHKNKLLSYDKNLTHASNIIDDETDWYEISDNVWLSNKQRDQAVDKIREEAMKKEEDERGIKLTFDVAAGRFAEDKTAYDASKAIDDAKKFMNEVTKTKQRFQSGASVKLSEDQEKVHQELSEQIRQKYKDLVAKTGKAPIEAIGCSLPKSNRVQHDSVFDEFKSAMEKQVEEEVKEEPNAFDEEIFPIEMDNGSCLSMHQPWASLVIYGIKRFEGRMWTTRYRGPLWIQAGSRVPSQEEIQAVEAQYRELYKGVKDLPPFPERYPTGCLLGLVDLEDVIRVEDYFKYIPEDKREETGCKYLFVCRNPRRLLYPIKYPGERQIFKIENMDLIDSARRSLIKVKTNWWPYYANYLRGKERIPDEDLELEMMRLEYVKEDAGTVISGFFQPDELKEFVQNLFEIIKSKTMKFVGKNYMQTMQISEKDPILAKLKKYIPLAAEKKCKMDREKVEKKMNFMDFFVCSEKEKDMKIEDKYGLILVFGRGVKFEYEFFKVKTVVVKNGSMILRTTDQKVPLSIYNLEKPDKDRDDDLTKDICKLIDNNSLVVMIY